MSLFAVVCHSLSLFVFVCRCLSLFVVVCRCLSLFVVCLFVCLFVGWLVGWLVGFCLLFVVCCCCGHWERQPFRNHPKFASLGLNFNSVKKQVMAHFFVVWCLLRRSIGDPKSKGKNPRVPAQFQHQHARTQKICKCPLKRGQKPE